jgi:MraZ protein
VFEGASALTLDGKGRMSIPSRYREALNVQCEGRVTITKHPDGCLLLYPRPEWEILREKLKSLPMSAHWWRRIFMGNASSVEVDATGRVLIAPELRQVAGLEKEVMLIGVGSSFEIWDAKIYAEKEKLAIEQGMPEALQNFTF